MKAYLVSFDGVYLGGEILVIDETKRKAFNKVKKELEAHGLTKNNVNLTMDDLEEVDLTKAQCIMIDNGDY